jgi:hypothetical protein
LKEIEEDRHYNAEQIQLWNLKQKQERENLVQSKRMVKSELDTMVQFQAQKKVEQKELDKMYGVAFAQRVAEESQKHQNVSIIKLYSI